SSSTSPVWIKAQVPGTARISGMWKEAALGQVTWDDAADGVTGDGIYSAPHNPALFGAYQGTYLFRFNNVADLRANKAGTLNTPAYGLATGSGGGGSIPTESQSCSRRRRGEIPASPTSCGFQALPMSSWTASPSKEAAAT